MKWGSGTVSASRKTMTSPRACAAPRFRAAASRKPSSRWRTSSTPCGTSGDTVDPSSVTTNLPSRDFDRTVAFYGAFGIYPSHRDEGWLLLRRGEMQLEFFLFAGLVPDGSSFMRSVRVDDLDGLYAEVAGSGVPEPPNGRPRLHPAELQPWGSRVAFLIDPDCTQLSLVENPSEKTR